MVGFSALLGGPDFFRTRVDRRLELPGRASSPVLYCSADVFVFVVACVTRAKVNHMLYVWTALLNLRG